MKGEDAHLRQEVAPPSDETFEHTSADTITSKYASSTAPLLSIVHEETTVCSRSKVKRGVQFMLRYKDGVMVVPDEHDVDSKETDREEGELEGEEQKESGEGKGELEEGEEEWENEERDSEEEGESDADPAEEFGSDLESEVGSEQEEGERQVEDSCESVDQSSSTDKTKTKVC